MWIICNLFVKAVNLWISLFLSDMYKKSVNSIASIGDVEQKLG